MSDSTPPPPPPPPPSDDIPPPPPPPAGDGAGGPSYGSLGQRFLARILDGLIVAIPMAIILWVLPGLSPGGFVGGLITGLAYLAYFVYFEGTTGQTYGKGIINMKVVPDGAEGLSYEKAFMRNWWTGLGILSGIPIIGVLVSLASLAIVIYIAVTISGDSRNQGWHDKLADTLVVVTA